MMKTNKPTAAEAQLEIAQTNVILWLTNVGTIETRLETARAALVRLEAERKDNALKAAMGDGIASETALRARRGHAEAQLEIEDLTTALTGAQARLAEMRVIADGASRARAKEVAAEILARRIKAAERFDAAAEELQKSHDEFRDIVDELGAIPGFDGFGAGPSATSRMEMVRGEHRIAAALPAFVDNLEIRLRAAPAKLARSEELIWKSYL